MKSMAMKKQVEHGNYNFNYDIVTKTVEIAINNQIISRV